MEEIEEYFKAVSLFFYARHTKIVQQRNFAKYRIYMLNLRNFNDDGLASFKHCQLVSGIIAAELSILETCLAVVKCISSRILYVLPQLRDTDLLAFHAACKRPGARGVLADTCRGLSTPRSNIGIPRCYKFRLFTQDIF